MRGKLISADEDKQVVSDYWKRFNLMDSARSAWEEERHYTDQQVAATVGKNAQGKLIVNIPIEKVLKEIDVGKYGGMPTYDITGYQGNNDVNMTQPIRFAMQDFLDREQFFIEKRAAIGDWSQYGTLQMFTGIREESYVRYEPTEVFDGLYSDDMKAIKRVEYKYCPQNRPIYTTWRDDQAMNQWDYRKAEDLIFEEQLSVQTAKEKFNLIEGFDTDEIKPYAIVDPEYGKYNSYPNQALFAYYYNRITSERNIIMNKAHTVWKGRYYHNGALPMDIAQHFSNNNSLYGDGKPKRVRAMKGYKNSILQDILDASKMSAGVNIIVPNGTDVIAKASSGINVWNTTGSDPITPFNLPSRIQDMASVLAIIDDMINNDAGENIRAPFSSPKTTLGEIEIMEEKQQIRDRTKDENLNDLYDAVLTKTCQNLTKYAVNMIKTTTTEKVLNKAGVEEEITTEYFPDMSINVKDHVIERKKLGAKDKDGKEKDSILFKKDFGKNGTFNLKDCTIDGEFMCKVVTPSTKFSSSIKKNSFTQAIQNLQIITQTFAAMGINMSEEIKQEFDPKNIMRRWKQTYEVDTKMSAQTEKDKIDAETKEQMKIAQAMMANDAGMNALSDTQNPNATPQTPPQATPAQDFAEPSKMGGKASLTI